MSPFLGIRDPLLCRQIDYAVGQAKPLVAPASASQFLQSSRRQLRRIPRPWCSVLPPPRDHPGGVLRLRQCARWRHRCVSLQHGPGCFGAFCPPWFGKLDRPYLWSLPPSFCRRCPIRYSVGGKRTAHRLAKETVQATTMGACESPQSWGLGRPATCRTRPFAPIRILIGPGWLATHSVYKLVRSSGSGKTAGSSALCSGN